MILKRKKTLQENKKNKNESILIQPQYTMLLLYLVISDREELVSDSLLKKCKYMFE